MTVPSARISGKSAMYLIESPNNTYLAVCGDADKHVDGLYRCFIETSTAKYGLSFTDSFNHSIIKCSFEMGILGYDTFKKPSLSEYCLMSMYILRSKRCFDKKRGKFYKKCDDGEWRRE